MRPPIFLPVLKPATVLYKAEANSPVEREGASTASIMRIISPAEARTNSLLAVGRYASLGSLQTVEHWRNAVVMGAVSGALIGGLVTYSKVTASSTAKKRRNALTQLGLEDDKSE